VTFLGRLHERERQDPLCMMTADVIVMHRRAATVMADTPAALQLRLLQTIVEVAAEKNSTVVLPFPVELLRFSTRPRASSPNGRLPVQRAADHR
jgi:hypothetical protein